jgi:triosephosphate isomerase
MNMLSADAAALAKDLVPLVGGSESVEVVVCPVFTVLSVVSESVSGSSIEVGGQNCYVEQSGAFTGEISPEMLQDAGCQWVIIGHSERRQYFDESDAFLNEKVHFALKSGLKVMFCIGETLEEREGGTMEEVLGRQITEGLTGLDGADFDKLVIAYEPVWAIGTGVTASPEQAEDAHKYVRGVMNKTFGADVAEGIRIQYGGSVKPDNAVELMSQPNVDGALVGGASLKASDFSAIVQASASTVA